MTGEFLEPWKAKGLLDALDAKIAEAEQTLHFKVSTGNSVLEWDQSRLRALIDARWLITEYLGDDTDGDI